MSLIKTTEESFEFPVLGFTSDGDFCGFPDMDILTIAAPAMIKRGMHEGMLLIDNGNNQWVVRSVRTKGRAARWTLLGILLYLPPSWRVEHELEKLPPLSLDEIKDRTCAAVRVSWYDGYEADGQEDEFEALLDQVRSARDVAHIYQVLGIDEFAGL